MALDMCKLLYLIRGCCMHAHCLRPIYIVSHYTASVDVTVLGFFSDPHQRVLCVCADGDGEPLVVTHNLLSRQHSIWLAQRATQNVSAAT